MAAKNVDWSNISASVLEDFPKLAALANASAFRERLEKELRRAYIAGQESIMKAEKDAKPPP